MRVASKTIFEAVKFNLGNITENLYKAHKVVATGKRITGLSDDPVGLTQVLNIKSTLSNIEQLGRNIDLGKSWLIASESALSHVQNMTSEAKVLCIQMATGTIGAAQRASAAETVQNMLEEILSLAITEVNGRYIFAGTKTDISPFVFDDEANPTKVTYSGNDSPFTVEIGRDKSIAVGQDGEKAFWDQLITIDSSNSRIDFKEDIGEGSDFVRTLAATIVNGTYTASELAAAVENAMNKASEDSGYDITYEVSYDTSTKKFTIKDNGAYPAFFGFQLLWDTGDNARVSNINIGGGIPLDDVTVTVNNNAALIHGTPSPPGTAPLRLTWDGTANWAVTNDPGYLIPAHIPGDANGVGIDLDGDTIADITISLSNPATAAGDFVEFDITPASGDYSVGPDLGFNVVDVTYTPPTSDSEVKYAIDVTNNKIDFKEVPTISITTGSNDIIDYKENGGAAITATLSQGIYTCSDMATEIETRLEAVGDADYTVTYDSGTNEFTITKGAGQLDILWNSGANAGQSPSALLGYDNDHDDSGGLSYSSEQTLISNELIATIDTGTWTSAELCTKIEAALEAATVNSADYTVSYDDGTDKFTIQSASGLTELQLLWDTGTNASAATVLGFDDTVDDTGNTNYTSDSAARIEIITDVNDKIDFKEQPKGGTLGGELTATISPGYYSASQLAAAIETAMETASTTNSIDYTVSYDSTTNKITIKENGTKLDVLQLLWKTGTNGSDDGDTSAASVLGFSDEDDIVAPPTSDREVEWGIFKTLIDLRDYLKTDDVSGIGRSMSRLDYHFENISAKISDIGSKIIRMEIKINIFQDLNLANTDRLSNIEDADIAEAIMDLKEKELAYQAALASSARIMELSLVNYL